MLANFVDVRDVRMIQCGSGFGFANKTLHPIAICRSLSRQNFKGYSAIEFSVFRQVHLTHAALTNLRADFVMTEFGTWVSPHGLKRRGVAVALRSATACQRPVTEGRCALRARRSGDRNAADQIVVRPSAA